MTDEQLKNAIRTVPDFPIKGILFYDVTSIFINPTLFQYCLDKMFEHYKNVELDAVACIESRGFIFASIMAYERHLPLILIRKPHKLPGKTISSESYSSEYSQDALEVQEVDVPKNGRVLVIDDVLATGGTMKTAVDLLQRGGAKVTHIFTIIELTKVRTIQTEKQEEYAILKI